MIRPLNPESDASGVVDLLHEVFPAGTTTAESWLQQQASIPARARHAGWVAIDDGTVVGRADASLNAWSKTETALAGVSVSRAFRRRGIGSALWEQAQRHLDDLAPSRVITWFMESPEGVEFARVRGFAEERADTLSCVDPSTVDPLPLSSDLAPLRDVSAREVYDVDLATTADVPMTDMVTKISYEEWLDIIWRRPTITHDGSFAAIVDDRVASVTMLAANVERGRAFTEYTGTLAEYRKRGLADRVKRASLAWAAANGIRAAWTTNDETNAPMLALNQRLGYTPRMRRVEYLRKS